jgi:membrane protein implicated in regulation of membrane protease activity
LLNTVHRETWKGGVAVNKRRIIGAAVFLAALEGIIAYGIMVYCYPVPTLQVTVFIMVALVLSLAAWIGYSMMTAKPKPEKEGGKRSLRKQVETGREASLFPV